MTWLQFLLWITGLYFLYYLVMILFDLRLSNRKKVGQAMSHELSFSEPVSTQHVQLPAEDYTPKPALAVPPVVNLPEPELDIIASGGVTMRNLFSLAREEAIQYTPRVSFVV